MLLNIKVSSTFCEFVFGSVEEFGLMLSALRQNQIQVHYIVNNAITFPIEKLAPVVQTLLNSGVNGSLEFNEVPVKVLAFSDVV